MAKLKVYNEQGADTGKSVELNARIFGVEPKVHLVQEVVTAILANRRRPIASTKTRGEVRGGGKKPWKQKGTGRARVGSIRSPLWRGGGIIFGPRANRNFKQKINAKAKQRAIFSVLSIKAAAGQLVILDNLTLDSGKTKDLAAKVKQLSGALENFGRKILVILPRQDDKVFLSSRNLSNVKVTDAKNLNIVDLLGAGTIVIVEAALPEIEKAYLK